MKYFLTTLLISFSILSIAQQSYPIGGTLKNASNKEPIVGATIFAITSDNTLGGGTISDEKGKFSLTLKRGEYTLKISYLGMAPYTDQLRVWHDDYLGTIYLTESTETLKGVDIKTEARQATVNGDTTSYNAKAFKTTQNASAGDLIEKMPGVQNSNGELRAQGEKVQQVTVDGKRFFGQDPKTALATLPAEVVDKIQIFDDQSEQSKASGVDDGTRIKTVNIVTKIEMRNGEFGKVYGGGGTDERYSAGGNINMFRGDRRLSVLGQTNNINQQNFSTDDLLGVVGDNSGGGGGGSRGGRGPGGGRPSFMSGFSAGGSSSDFQVSSTSGITKTIAGGLNYQDIWGKKVDVSTSYFYNYGDNFNNNRTYEKYYLQQNNGQDYLANDTTSSININHKFNAKLVYKLNEKISFFYVPSLTVQQNDGINTLQSNTTQEAAVVNALTQTFTTDLAAYTMSNDLMLRINGEKRGRSFFAQIKNDRDRTDGTNQLNSIEQQSNGVINNIDQLGDLNEDGNGWSGSMMYSEPIGEKGLSTFVSYDYSNSENIMNKQTFSGVIGPNVGTFDSSLSSRYNNDWEIHSAGLGLRKFGRQGGFVVRAKLERASLSNKQQVPLSENVNANYLNVLPFALYRASFKNKASLFSMYRTYVTRPQASQLTATVNNSNPLQLKSGNQNLNQQYGHWFMTRYNAANLAKSSIFFATINGGISNQYIGQSTFTASADTTINGTALVRGAQLVSPINLNGQYSINSFVTYGLPVKKLKSNLNANLSAGLTNIPSLINAIKANTLNQNYQAGLVLSSNISDKIDFTLSTESSYNVSSNSLNSTLNNTYLVQTSKVKYDWVMPKGFTFRTQLQHQKYFGLNSTLDNTVLLWTAAIGKQVFENKRGEVQLTMFDILGQNNNVNQNFYDSYYQETTSNVLTRYLMLSFSYNIRKFRKDPNAMGED
jgi:hypothetical protein